jgi:hypothetical protein
VSANTAEARTGCGPTNTLAPLSGSPAIGNSDHINSVA